MYSRVHAGYTFTQDDVDAGHVTNTATASALSPTGATNTSTDDVDTTIPARQGVSLDKQAGAPTGATESSTIDCTFVVTNIRKRDAARCDAQQHDGHSHRDPGGRPAGGVGAVLLDDAGSGCGDYLYCHVHAE